MSQIDYCVSDMVQLSEVISRRVRSAGFNSKKFKQVLHYFIHKTSSQDNIGKKALFKLLYFNDFDYYELFEKQLTGEVYSKLEHGPAPRHFNDIIKELKEDGSIVEKRTEYFGKTQIKFISKKKPDVSLLTANELEHLEDTICRYGKMNGSQIEALSHKDTPWEIAETNKNLDYEMVFYRDPSMSVREYADD
ncbi:Panacea domain-containing protein [Methanoregula sp.]|jgi:uncharacterized phage-associated protein|uniref:Panacea domain-containing protein n=1 Tax=Methanoregula sp. TaxID=2052170 RepID=UPI003C1A2BF3